MPAGPATRTSRRGRSKAAGRPHGGHALAGFVLGMMAVSAAFLIGGPAGQSVPQSEAQESAASFAAVRMALDPEARPTGGAPTRAQPVAFATGDESLFTNRHATRIVLASAGIDAEVRPVGYTFRDGRLQYDVPQIEAGHYVGTAQPGRPGNTVIGGHVSRRGGAGIFAALPQVRAGDIVEVHQGEQTYRYIVTEIRIVAADATSVMSPTQDATLTLITCFPDDDYQERLVVVGRLIDSA
jgi:LPXTG-site transpeptidase (sortase) family protein